MGIKAIDYENLSEGDLVTWYGVHVLRWERDIRPYGIEPSIAFVQDDTQEILITELLETLKIADDELDFIISDLGNVDWDSIQDTKSKIELAIAKAEGE